MNNKESRANLKELRERFLDGDKITIKEIVEDYFDPKTPYSYLVALKRARGYIANIKMTFRRKEGIWFGNLDNEGNYGIATTIEEVGYAMITYYKFIKGNLMSANMLMGNAKANNILPKGIITERLLVAKLEENEDKS